MQWAQRSLNPLRRHMDRKQFLGTLFVLPAGIFLVHCSSDSTSSGGAGGTATSSAGAGGTSTSGAGGGASTAPGADPVRAGTMVTYTSSTAGKHIHTFTLDDSDIASPPSAGISGMSSTDSMHSHSVDISADQLAMVAAGGTVEVTSGVTGMHTHVFTFLKIA
jgi:hypothetical protein